MNFRQINWNKCAILIAIFFVISGSTCAKPFEIGNCVKYFSEEPLRPYIYVNEDCSLEAEFNVNTTEDHIVYRIYEIPTKHNIPETKLSYKFGECRLDLTSRSVGQDYFFKTNFRDREYHKGLLIYLYLDKLGVSDELNKGVIQFMNCKALDDGIDVGTKFILRLSHTVCGGHRYYSRISKPVEVTMRSDSWKQIFPLALLSSAINPTEVPITNLTSTTQSTIERYFWKFNLTLFLVQPLRKRQNLARRLKVQPLLKQQNYLAQHLKVQLI